MTALALRDDQTYWDEAQLAVLRANGIDDGVTKPELQTFLHECQRRRLDPFTRQIYLIGRWDKRQKRKVYRSQTGIDGFRVVARRAADEAKETIEYEDTLWCGPDGQWTDVWLDTDPPAACKVVVLRNGKRFPATARFTAYVQTNDDGRALGLWEKMPDGQIAKCTEALALRKAFPEDLGGLYTEEEMAQADNPQQVTATVEVVRDEPVNGKPALSGGKPEGDPQWDALVAQMPTFATDEEGRPLWAAIVDRRKAGKISAKEDSRLKEIIKARWAELKAVADEEPVEGEIVPDLDPEDPWAKSVQAVTTTDEAADLTTAVMTALSAHEIDDAKAAAIHAAIAHRENDLTGQGAFAA
jgi:phage recombination protein Bet